MKENELKPCPLCGSYTITQEMMEELRMAHKEQGQHGDPVGEKGVNPLEAIKADVAREIFAEVDNIAIRKVIRNGEIVYDITDKYEELKKKYTEGGGLNEIHALHTPASRY